jgi:hypothetical protein
MVTEAKLETNHLDALFDNDVGAVRIPGFLTDTARRAAVNGIYQQGLAYYRDVFPPIGRIGITQYEHRHGDDARREYFARAAEADADRRRMFSASGDLVDLVMAALSAAWPRTVAVASEPNGSRYFAGLVRVIGEALLHCDWARFDAPAPRWAIGAVNAQLTWNIYCQTRDSGGATFVYRRPWTPDAQQFQLPNSYGYDPGLIDGCDVLRIKPVNGDLVLFNSRNFHSIESGTGSDRISVSSFVGRFDDGSLVLWS